MLSPKHEAFEQAMKVDTFDIVRSRQFHNDKHVPGCFKYGSKKFQFRFPRKLVPDTVFDEMTGIILQKRDREWLNLLQQPAVINPGLYVGNRVGHHLWRSLTTVVVLRQHIRQVGDPLYVGILCRIRPPSPN
jgi:hypothetical protein